MRLIGEVSGCSHGGVWYTPAGWISDHYILSPRRVWFDTREKAEAYREELRASIRSQMANLQLQLEAV